MVLPRNDYNLMYLKANTLSNFILNNKQRIKTYLREVPGLQLRTLQQMEQCFMKCDKNRTGQISRRAFLLKLAKNNISIPQHLVNNILDDMQLVPGEVATDDSILVYKNLIDIIDIFITCPSILVCDHNKSTNFINSLERMPMMKTVE